MTFYSCSPKYNDACESHYLFVWMMSHSQPEACCYTSKPDIIFQPCKNQLTDWLAVALDNFAVWSNLNLDARTEILIKQLISTHIWTEDFPD